MILNLGREEVEDINNISVAMISKLKFLSLKESLT